MTTKRSSLGRYVLVTAAYNEGNFIENTLRSVVSQSRQPVRWVVVSDGSTDNTDEVVARYAAKHPFIQLCRLAKDHARNFAAQVDAINEGIAKLAEAEFDFIGNLDADITFSPRYFKGLLEKFREDPQLGLAGGVITEKCPDGTFRGRRDNSLTSVAHAVQLFRRECFQDIGGRYIPLPFGGPDTYAEVSARMKGWRVASFADLQIQHHRVTGSAGGLLRGCFRQGRMDQSLGTLPAFEVMKVLRRMHVKPFIVGASVRAAGFLYAHLRREPRAVSAEFAEYFRREQSGRIRQLVRGKKHQSIGLQVQRMESK